MIYGVPPSSTDPTYLLVLEYCDTDLTHVVLDTKAYPEYSQQTALELATGVACGMAYIQTQGVLHLDMKLVRIASFCLSTHSSVSIDKLTSGAWCARRRMSCSSRLAPTTAECHNSPQR